MDTDTNRIAWESPRRFHAGSQRILICLLFIGIWISDTMAQMTDMHPRIIDQSQSLELPAGTQFELFVHAEGPGPLSFHWFFNGHPLMNIQGPTLPIAQLSPDQVGEYLVEVRNDVGSVWSDPIRVEINPATSGGVQLIWNARYESDEGFNSFPVGVFRQSNGQTSVAGEFAPDGSQDRDFLAVQYDASGKMLGARRISFSDTSQEFALKALRDAQGNVLIGGVTLVNPVDLVDEITPDLPKGPIRLPFLASVGGDSSVRWTFTPPIGLEDVVELVDMQMDGNNGVYILGNTISEEYSGMVLQRLAAANGEPSDSIHTDDPSPFRAQAMSVAPSGGLVYILGQTRASDGNATGVEVRCYQSATGKPVWKSDLGTLGLSNFVPRELHAGPAGKVYLVGHRSTPETKTDIQVVLLNQQGGEEWQLHLGLPGDAEDMPTVADVDSAGALVVAGTSSSVERGQQIMLGKFLPEGQLAWALVLPSSMPRQPDRATNIHLDSAGNIYLSAVRFDPSTGQDFASFRFDADGAFIYESRFRQEGFAVEEATHIHADDQGNAVVSGFSIVGGKKQLVTVGQQPTPAIPNQLPRLDWNGRPFEKPVKAPGKWKLQVNGKDPDGKIVKVEFVQGTQILGTDEDPPYVLDFASDMPGDQQFFARAYDQSGGVTISEAITVKIESRSQNAPTTDLSPEDVFLTEGTEWMLDFEIAGTEPLRYQWFLNGERLKDADGATLPIQPGITRENSGSYQLRAQNQDGILLTDPVIVSVDWPELAGADQFEDAVLIGGNSGFIRTSNAQAGQEPGEPRHANKRGGKSIWYRWRPDVSGLATVSVQGSSFDTLLAVYAGTSLTQLTELESDDDRGGFSTSALQFNAIGGVDYLIVIDGFNGADGNILMSWELDPAQVIDLPRIRIEPDKNTVNINDPYLMTTSVTGSLQGVTLQWIHNGAPIPGATGTEYNIAAAQPGDAGAYWIEITAGNETAQTKPGHLTVNVPRRGRIVRELVLEEKFADLFFFVQDGNPGPLFQPQRRHGAFLPRAASLATGFTGAQIFNTFGATKEAGEPDHCGIPGGASQWFAYQAPADGTLNLSTDGSDFDTVLAVYNSTGSSFADLIEVACDNDSGLDGQDSSVSFEVTANAIYYIAVDGVEGATGTVNLAYELEVGLALQSVGMQELGLVFEVQTVPNMPFTIEGTEDFETWTILENTTSPDGTFIFRDNDALIGTQRFYRVYVTE